MTGVWVATLERFGYTLMVVERSKQKAVDALVGVYKQTYQKRNQFNSIEEMENDEEFKHYYELAMEELYVRKLEYGIVEWC
jgi:hypothetical protein